MPSDTLPTELPAEPIPGYRLVRQLGQGAFGEVWEAVGPGGFPVALKLVPLGGKVGESELRALEVIKGIRHAHLLATFGAWQVGGRLIIAVELADKTLLDRLHESIGEGRSGIPGPELLEYMREAGKGLDYLNEPRHFWDGQERVGIQHRDIKPQNLLLLGGTVKVADFGLARVLEERLATRSAGFTPAYAPPEFFEPRATPWSDQYSLAVTYCQLRGGRLPFTGNAAALMAGHLAREPDLTMLPEAERPVALRALAKKPDQRWPNCQEFVKALAAVGSLDETALLTTPETAPTAALISAGREGNARRPGGMKPAPSVRERLLWSLGGLAGGVVLGLAFLLPRLLVMNRLGPKAKDIFESLPRKSMTTLAFEALPWSLVLLVLGGFLGALSARALMRSGRTRTAWVVGTAWPVVAGGGGFALVFVHNLCFKGYADSWTLVSLTAVIGVLVSQLILAVKGCAGIVAYETVLITDGGKVETERQMAESVEALTREHRKFRVGNRSPGCVVLEVGVSWASWGEWVTIEAEARSIRIVSECALPFQVVDWGKNRRNVDLVRSALLRAISGVAEPV